MESNEDYLNKNVKPIMEALAESVMIASPEDHVSLLFNNIIYNFNATKLNFLL